MSQGHLCQTYSQSSDPSFASDVLCGPRKLPNFSEPLLPSVVWGSQPNTAGPW